jgi:hypothetical protein
LGSPTVRSSPVSVRWRDSARFAVILDFPALYGSVVLRFEILIRYSARLVHLPDSFGSYNPRVPSFGIFAVHSARLNMVGDFFWLYGFRCRRILRRTNRRHFNDASER